MSTPPASGAGAARQGWRSLRPSATALVPLLAVALAFLVGSVLILITSIVTAGGLDFSLPIRGYGAMLEGAGITTDPDRILNGLINTAVQAGPLVLGGLSVGLAFKAGLFNIGAYGQVLMGALAAAVVGASVAAWPAPLAIGTALLAGSLAGAAWGFIPWALKA